MNFPLILLCNGFDKCTKLNCDHKVPHKPHPHHDLGSCYYMKVEYSCYPIEQLYDQLKEVK